MDTNVWTDGSLINHITLENLPDEELAKVIEILDKIEL
jgi:hypothetical protein